MILSDLTPPEEALNPLNLARGIATTLDAENRELNDLEGLRSGRFGEPRSLDASPLLPPFLPSSGKVPAAARRRDAESDFLSRRHLDRASSLEELILELYCGNLSVARVEKMVRSWWGRGADITLVCRYGAEIEHRLRLWLRRPLSARYPYVFLQRSLLKVGKTGRREGRGLFVAVGVTDSGLREVLGLRLGAGADETGWETFLDELVQRGLAGTQLFLGDNDAGSISAVSLRFPAAAYQGDFAQMERVIMRDIPPAQIPETEDLLAAVRRAHSPVAARLMLGSLHEMLGRRGSAGAAGHLAEVLPLLHNFARFPRALWPQLRAGGSFTKVMRDCRELIRLGGSDPNPEEIQLRMAARWRRASRAWARRKSVHPTAPRARHTPGPKAAPAGANR